MARPAPRVRALLADLEAARQAFTGALGDVDPALRDAPGLVGEWSARELLGHMGYWAGHAAEAIHHAEEGRLDEFGRDDLSVDARNAVVARVARDTDFATAQSREQAAFDALATRLARVDPEWLDERDAGGDSLAEVIADDGADHYREHATDIRAWFSGEPDGADGDVEDADGGA